MLCILRGMIYRMNFLTEDRAGIQKENARLTGLNNHLKDLLREMLSDEAYTLQVERWGE